MKAQAIMEPYINSTPIQLSLIGLNDLTMPLDNWNKDTMKVDTINIEKDDIHLAPVEGDDSETLEVKLSDSILNKDQQKQLTQLIREFASIFAKNSADLGHTSLVKHVIQLKDGVTPTRSRPYPVPDKLKPVLKQQVNELLESGVITQSSAPNFVSPVLFVPKKDKTYRMCVDYRALNEGTVKSHQLLPTIPNIADVLAHRRYFSGLDLSAGYWQVEMDAASQDLTTFITPGLGVYKWKRMPFGLTNAPATFQRLMNAVLADFINDGDVICYVDDVLVASRTFSEHMDLLQRVFKRLQDSGLKLKLSKASWCGREITYLGHIISEHGFAPSPDNTKRLTEYPSPTTVKETQRIVGLLSYYRRHVRDFAKFSAPMNKAIKKNQPFRWTEECETALRYLIDRVTHAPILRFPILDGKSPYILTTDASGVSVAAALAQVQNGVEYPISFYSRSLNDTERRWGSAEMEVAAIVAGINAFRQYLLGNRFTVYTDNSACVQILRKPNLSPKLHRWSLLIQGYDFTIHHKEGRLNKVCDALSRVPVNSIREIPPEDEIRVAQRRDDSLAPIIRYLKDGEMPSGLEPAKKRRLEAEWQRHSIINDTLYRKGDGEMPVVVIPDQYKEVLLHKFHSSIEGMHLGIEKTTKNLLTVCYWERMRKDVETYLANCDSCARIKNPHQRIRVPMKGQMTNHVLETVCSDIAGPLPVTTRGNKWIIVFIDQFSKYCEILPMPDATADTVARIYVEEFVTRYGTPVNLLTDQGTNYMSDLMRKVNDMLEIRHKRTTPYHPGTNGQAERLIKVIKFCLAHVVNEQQRNWDSFLGFIRMAINQSWHATTNTSPAYVFFGRSMVTPTKLLLPRPQAAVIQEGQLPALLEARMQYIWGQVREYMRTAKQTQKEYYDRRVVAANLDIGDRVFKYTPRGRPGLATKLLQHWIGPYIVTRISDTNAWIRPVARPYTESKCVHLNLLKKFKGTNVPPEDTEVSDDEEELTDETTDTPPQPPGDDHEPTDMEEMEAVREEMAREQSTQMDGPPIRSEELVERRGLRRRPKPQRYDEYEYY